MFSNYFFTFSMSMNVLESFFGNAHRPYDMHYKKC